MNIMKKIFPALFVIAVMIVLPCGFLEARGVRIWSDQELAVAADVVVNASPVSTRDTNESTTLGGQPVIGVETEFAVIVMVKGDPAMKKVIFHYYRPTGNMIVANAPTFVTFDLKKKQVFQLFLKRETDGRYAPAAGQEDAYLSIHEKKYP